MSVDPSTSWSSIVAAASGELGARERFASRYVPSVRSFFASRWGAGSLRGEIEDAVQEVFVDCLRPGGVLERVRVDHGACFRALLRGVARVVALRFEKTHRDSPVGNSVPTTWDPVGPTGSIASELDREHASRVLRDVLTAMDGAPSDAVRRKAAILRMRFEDGLPVRDIAALLDLEVAFAHREFRRARLHLRDLLIAALRTAPGESQAELEARCVELLRRIAR